APVEEGVQDLDDLDIRAGGEAGTGRLRGPSHQLVPEPPGLVLVGGGTDCRRAVGDVIARSLAEPGRVPGLFFSPVRRVSLRFWSPVSESPPPEGIIRST